MRRIVVSGSRTITDRVAVQRIVNRHVRPGFDVLVHGDCEDGVDKLADQWAKARGVERDLFTVTREDWRRLGRKAGPLRNRRMLRTGDILVAIWDGRSPGTRSAIRIAQELRVETHLYFLQGGNK